MRTPIIYGLMPFSLALTACTPEQNGGRLFANSTDLLMTISPNAPNYVEAQYDLNKDGRMEHIIYITDPCQCGTGGCGTMILTPVGNKFRLVGDISLGWPPIEVLPSKSNRWHDLSVRISGGGTTPHRALLPFDGVRYPANATMAPARPHQQPAEAELFSMNVFNARQTKACVTPPVALP